MRWNSPGWQPQLLAILRIVTALLFLQHPLVKLFGFPPEVPPGQVPVGSLFWIAGIVEIVASPINPGWIVYAPRRVHRRWRNGDRLLDGPLADELLSDRQSR
jgi:hypothetical protein